MENQNQSPKAQLIERLKQANNVLVTVSRNPSVDQLSAAIGLTLMLNNLNKHATAVFSGEVPNTLEFLKPEETLEKTTDSLRDFIISLDKAKADKLRYKVEDKMVKIFITPYRTSLSEADLIFGQGDFNVDVVVAVGVQEKDDLDEAITSHGRILHDATVATVNTVMSGQLGSINWVDSKASSLSEMLVTVCEGLKTGALDAQMATAFLTGIVAETDRFSNEKTSSDTMSVSSKLMAAGANQQLVATKLEEPVEVPVQNDNPGIDIAEDAVADALNKDGSLDISHTDNENQEQDQSESTELPEIQPDHQPQPEAEQSAEEVEDDESKPSRLILEPPALGGKLTANTEPEGLDPSTDPLTVKPVDAPLLTHDKEDVDITEQPPEKTPEVSPQPPSSPAEEARAVESDGVQEPNEESEAPEAEPQSAVAPELPAPEPNDMPAEPEEQSKLPPAEDSDTLSDIEKAVESPHVAKSMKEEPSVPDAEAALAAAHQAFEAASTDVPEKPAAFNSTGLMDVGHEEANTAPDTPENTEPLPEAEAEPSPVQIDPTTGMLSYPTNLVPPRGLPDDPTAAKVEDPTAPPEVPPPIPPTMMQQVLPPQEPSQGEQIDPNNLPPIPQ
jgi:hypothetical protein